MYGESRDIPFHALNFLRKSCTWNSVSLIIKMQSALFQLDKMLSLTDGQNHYLLLLWVKKLDVDTQDVSSMSRSTVDF